MNRSTLLETTLAVTLTAICMAAGTTSAQGPPDMADLVSEFSRGRFISPLMCEIDGESIRGIRRVVIAPELIREQRKGLLVQFVDMKTEGATRCINNLGQKQPNVIGKLQIALPSNLHPETAKRDFKRALKRNRGFDFEIVEGWLKITPVQQPPGEPQVENFRGGKARIGTVAPATDADRELADFESPRKLILELESKAGLRLALPLALAGVR
jgi:hypothetical protein